MKRSHGCEKQALKMPSNRSDKVQVDKQDINYPYKKLKDAHFPAQVEALAHVLELMNELVKSPEEVMIAAVQNNDLERFNELKMRFGYARLGKAMIAAAQSGLLDVVTFILAADGAYDENEEVDEEDDSGDGNYMSWEAKKDAAVAAAGNGHIDLVKLLFPHFIFREYDSDDEDGDNLFYQGQIFKGTWDVLENAAENGHLDVVTFAINHAKDRNYWHWYGPCRESSALERASGRGHANIVTYLLNEPEAIWDIAGAFVKAAVAREHTIAKLLFGMYSKANNENLFVEMARKGRVDAIRYLQSNGFVSSDLFRDELLAAVEHESIDSIEFFLATGVVISDLFDKLSRRLHVLERPRLSCFFTTKSVRRVRLSPPLSRERAV